MPILIDATRIDVIIRDCLYRAEELTEPGKAPEDAVIVDALTQKFGFHPQRLEGYRAEVWQLCQQLPTAFHEDTGGGWSFLNMCMDKEENLWGQHRDCEALLALAVGLSIMTILLPREMWGAFPGGMPYVMVQRETAR